MRIGRNDPCFCGSGKKYKKCCLPRGITPYQYLLEKMREPEPFLDKGRLIGRPFISTEFKGKNVRAVGNEIVFRPPEETFHEFLVHHLKHVLGFDWGLRESQRPKNEQHIVVQWISELGRFVEEHKTEENKVRDNLWSMPPTGNIQALISFAWDIYSLAHAQDLPGDVIERIKDKNEFQGAKYEVAVAAIFSRAGFNIGWQHSRTDKHPEFVAKHRYTKEEIAVEAKSRRRPGALHELGTPKNLKGVKAGVHRLLNRAIAQNPGNRPFMIFVDLNLPMSPELAPFRKEWFADLRKTMDNFPSPTPDEPEVFNALFVTNFAWHYYRDKEGSAPGEYIMVAPRYTKHPFKDPGLLSLLATSVGQYGQVPHDV